MRTHIPIRLVVAGSILVLSQAAMGLELSLLSDTWVREDSAASNRNNDGAVNARTDIDADDNDVILLRFSTTALTQEALNSGLTLFWHRDDSGTGNSLSLWGLNETDPDELTWDETLVTYNTAPGLLPDGANPTVEFGLGNTNDEIRDLDMANLTLLVENQPYGPQVLNSPYLFSSTALTDFINADTNGEVTFLIARGVLATSGNQARFQVKEAGLGAVLDATIPEPGTYALLMGLGVLAFIIRRRCR